MPDLMKLLHMEVWMTKINTSLQKMKTTPHNAYPVNSRSSTPMSIERTQE
jgi:hypothetical protein